MAELIPYENIVIKNKAVNNTIKKNFIPYENTVNKNTINNTNNSFQNKKNFIPYENTINKKTFNENTENNFIDKTTKQSSQLDIEFANEHPDFKNTNGFDVRLIPDFDSIEDASVYYGLPIDKLTSEIIPEVPIQGDNSYDNINYNKKFIPTLSVEDGFYDKGSFNPFDDKKSNFDLTSKTMDYIWGEELGINKETVAEIESPFWKKIAGNNIVMGTTDVLDGALRTIQSVIYGGAGVVGDIVTNITGNKGDGARTQRDLIALFESTLPQQMSTAGASARSWGYTKNQVKKYDKLGKEAINNYVEVTFKDSPNKTKIKTDLVKKFDEGIIKADSVVKKLEQNVGKVLNDKRITYKYFDDSVKKTRFKEDVVKLNESENIKNLLQFSESPILRQVDKWILSPFRTRGRKTPEMQTLHELYQGKIRGNNHRAVSTAKQIERELNLITKKFDPNIFNYKYKNKKQYKKSLLDDIQEVLLNKKSISILDESLRKPVGKARVLIDNLSKQLIESNGLGKPTKKIIEDNIGAYVRQSYKLFTNKGFQPNKKIRQNAFDYIQKQDPSLSTAEVNGVLNKILNKSENTGLISTMDSLSPKLKQNIFLKRKDLAPEIKALLGEVKNPLENLLTTVNDLTKWVEADKYFSRLKKEGVNKYFFQKPTNRFATEITSNRYNPLKGWHTTPEIANLLKSIDDTPMSGIGSLYKPFLYAKGVSQYAKTVLNHVTQIRNVHGGILMSFFNGVNPFSKNGWSAIKTVANDIGKMSDEALNLKYENYLDLGLVRTSVKANELKLIFKDVEASGGMAIFIDKVTNNFIFNNAKKPFTFLQDVYMGVDDVFKIIVYESELATLSKAYPDMLKTPTKLKQLEKQASQIVTNTMPTYDKVPPAIKAIRRLPIGNFVSFPAEILRNTVYSVKQSIKEISTPNSVIKARGVKRMTGNVIVGGIGLKSLSEGFNIVQDYSEEVINAVKSFVPSWSENSEIILLNNDPNNLQYIDPSYTYPYEILHKPIRTAINEYYKGNTNNKNLDEIITNAGIQAIKQFVLFFADESMITAKILDITRNKQDNGREVYNPELPVGDRLESMFLHVLDAFVPAGYDQLEKLYKSLNGISEPYGKEYDPKIELIANLGGFRISQINIEEAFNFKVPEHNSNVGNSERIFRKIANQRNVVTENEYVNAYITAEKARYKNWTDMNTIIQNAYTLGVSEQKIAKMLLENNISKDDVKMYLSEKYLPYFPSKETLGRIYESGNVFPINQIETIYKNLANIPLGDYQKFTEYLNKGLGE